VACAGNRGPPKQEGEEEEGDQEEDDEGVPKTSNCMLCFAREKPA